MAAESDVVARVLRRRAEPTQLLQILREAQEELGWISPEAARAIASSRFPFIGMVAHLCSAGKMMPHDELVGPATYMSS